jgi:threonine aldolase
MSAIRSYGAKANEKDDSMIAIIFLVTFHAVKALAIPSSINLQSQHAPLSPAETLAQLSEACLDLGISSFDVYGDFDVKSSYLRKFESEVAAEFDKEDAVFMPSGVMAQSIALLIHGGTTFACHHSSHLLLHEAQSYCYLIHKEPLIIDTTHQVAKNGYSVPAMSFEDVHEAFEKHFGKVSEGGTDSLSTLIIELPHRELGGKCTPWEDIVKMRDLCDNRGIKLHCDGARIFEATCYYNATLSEIASVFDSVYISFYKGLGGISGAMLLGDTEFCEKARTWLRRFGGNLYTLLPYAASGWAGYRRHWLDVENNMSFQEKHQKILRLVAQIGLDDVVSFDPEIPEVNMVHGYFRHSVDCISAAIDRVEQQIGLCVLKRVSKVEKTDHAYGCGYRSKFEWTVGAANGKISDSDFLQAWKALASELTASRSSL